jgi:pseudo-rSAM protein
MAEQMRWLYLEPYVFFNFNGKSALLFNELNNAYLEYENIEDEVFLYLCEQLSNNENNYCIPIEKKDVTNYFFNEFVRDLKRTYSGDFVYASSLAKPFITKPQIFVNNSIEYLKRDSFFSIGYKSKLYLVELTIHTGSYELKNKCKGVFSNYNKTLNKSTINKILDKLSHEVFEYRNLRSINLICYPNTDMLSLIDFIKNVSSHFDTTIHMELSHYLVLDKRNHYDNLKYNLYIDSKMEMNQLLNKSILLNENIRLCIFVNDEELLSIALTLCDSLHNHVEIIPQYINNIDFFNKNVFLSKDDIFNNQSLTIHKILTNGLLNRIFWGKIVVNSNGNICPHNSIISSNLSIIHNSLDEAIIDELNGSKTWFLKRNDVKPCKDCLYCLICPPISEYELELGRFNLCNINN